MERMREEGKVKGSDERLDEKKMYKTQRTQRQNI